MQVKAETAASQSSTIAPMGSASGLRRVRAAGPGQALQADSLTTSLASQRSGPGVLRPLPEKYRHPHTPQTVAGRLFDGNGMAITQARTAALRFILAPSVGLKQAGKGMLGLIIAPDHLVSKVRERGRHDPVDGVLAAAGTGATYIGLASLATMAVGGVVALATHGELSLIHI